MFSDARGGWPPARQAWSPGDFGRDIIGRGGMLVPRMTAKYLFDAEPGELVRTNGPNGPVLGLVSGLHFNDPRMQKLLIHLTPPGQQPGGPCYTVIQEHARSTALSFGRGGAGVA